LSAAGRDWEWAEDGVVTEDEIRSAIRNQNLFIMANLNASQPFLTRRLHEISGMIELALMQKATHSFVDFLVCERESLQRRIDEIEGSPGAHDGQVV
jgi:hypothetical protein